MLVNKRGAGSQWEPGFLLLLRRVHNKVKDKPSATKRRGVRHMSSFFGRGGAARRGRTAFNDSCVSSHDSMLLAVGADLFIITTVGYK